METIKVNNIIGIDISKKTFDVALLINNKLNESNIFSNNLEGFNKLILWLKSKNTNLNSSLFCMEKTGIYSNMLSNFLSTNKYKLWLEDPLKISKAQGFKRGKNDKIDAIRIAEYAFRFQDKIDLFDPNDEIYQKMNHLFSLRERLVLILGILNKPLFESKGIFDQSFQLILESICSLPILYIKASIKTVDKKLDESLKENTTIKEKYKIVTSVKGIGKQTAIYLLIITRGFTKIKTARKCSCFGGMAPFEYSSGTSVKGRTKVSCFGNKKLKKLIHMGAISILNTKKGEEYEYYCRKVSEGKHKMKVINALRNKILARVFSCIKGNRMYEESYDKYKKAS